MKDTGGPAFPTARVNINGVDEQEGISAFNAGMTLRDYFAAKAMQAFIDPSEWQSTVGPISSEVAFNAYAMADAMLEERKR